MELSLHNVGIIRDFNVKLDGLTVITGKNSSGKTTVGKVIYSLIGAGSDPVEVFEDSRSSYIRSQLREVERTLHLQRVRQMGNPSSKLSNEYYDFVMTLIRRRYVRFDINELIDFLIETRSFITQLSSEVYKEIFLSDENRMSVTPSNFLSAVADSFTEWKERALIICDNTLELINDKDAFDRFLKDRTAAFLNHEFNRQIRPVRARASVAHITLSDQDKVIMSAKVRSKNLIEFSNESTFLYPYEKCIFIDNPFVIDQLDDYDHPDRFVLSHGSEEDHQKALISSKDIESRDDVLIQLLLHGEKKNFFSDLEIQKKYGQIFEKINKIVPGEFKQTSDGVFYVEEGAPLSVKNLATGSKMFFIIKKLLRNGLLDDRTMLVLDEPESHLHPEWINKFAEILVVLIKDIKLNVLLTTHSPNLMLALNVHAKKAGIVDDSHFYLAEKMKDSNYSQIRCIDDCIGEGYSHLSLPLVEMNLQLEELTNEE